MIVARAYVLLVTYNGERFLVEQLESLLSQIKSEIKVLVFDNGSIDGTQAILKSYMQMNLIESLTITSGEEVSSLFLKLLEQVPPGYPALFCDQDDIWASSKVHTLLSNLNQSSADLVFSRLFQQKHNRRFCDIRHRF